MKKIFTLCVASALCATSMADNYATKLDKNMVFYFTNDTTMIQPVIIEDEDTGEEIEVLQETFWMGTSMAPAFKALNLPLKDASSTKLNYVVTTRNNYKDAETGFEMPAGQYRGIFVDGTMDFTGYDKNENFMVGYQNIKSMVLYFVPIPTAWKSDNSISHQDYPTGRVQARYMSLEAGAEGGGTILSNQAYREAHMNETADPLSGDDQNIKGTHLLNFERDAENPKLVTIDQPYKLTFTLNNEKDGSDYEGLFASDSGDDWVVYDGVKKSEFANFICENETTEGVIDYFFADINTTRPYTKNDVYSSCATGYDCYANKWGEKLPWSPETIIQLQVKKRMYLVGMALVCGTEGAASQFVNTSDLKNAAWQDSAVAYGVHGEQSIEAVSNDSQASSRIYNLQGQQLQNAKGLCIQNGKITYIK